MRNLLENIKKNSQKLLNLTPKDKEKNYSKISSNFKRKFQNYPRSK